MDFLSQRVALGGMPSRPRLMYSLSPSLASTTSSMRTSVNITIAVKLDIGRGERESVKGLYRSDNVSAPVPNKGHWHPRCKVGPFQSADLGVWVIMDCGPDPLTVAY